MQFSWKFVGGFVVFVVLIIASLGLINNNNSSQPARIPTEVEVASAEPKIETSEVHSPDGKANLIVDKTIQSTGNTIYSFKTADIPETNRELLYEIALPANFSLEIPLNSWSPDNKYVFLKEKTSSSSSFLVFKADRENFSEEIQYIDVGKGFNAANNGYELGDVTGWDGMNLLAVKGINKDGDRASFWFEVPSGAVIRLAR